MPSHTHKRGGVYYTRLVVPARLRAIIGKADLGRSLGTKDLAEAKRLQPFWLIEAQATIAAAEAKLAGSQTAASADTRMSPEAHWSEARFDYEQELFAIQMEDSAAEVEMLEQAEALEERLKQPAAQLTPGERVAAFLLRNMEEQRDGYRRRYRRRKFGRNKDGASSPTPATPTSPPHSGKSDKRAATISEIFEGYAGQEDSNPETVKQFRSIIKHLIAFLGHDDAQRVDHADLVRWREHLRGEPARAGKPRSAKTINDSYLSAVSATFRYGKNQLLVEVNPAAELAKVRASKSAKLRERHFLREEQRTILEAALVPAGGETLARACICAALGAVVVRIYRGASERNDPTPATGCEGN